VQDGHSTSEELLYRTLWAEGRPEGPNARMITVGYRGISSLTRMDPKTVKYLCRNLVAKLAMEQVAGENVTEGIGRTYRVFSPAAVLERRTAAGMEWILRRPGGRVEFIPRDQLHPGGNLPRDNKSGPGGDLSFRPVAPEKSYLQTAPALFGPVARAFLEIVPGTEDDAVENLIADCLSRVPDATGAEIAHFLQLKGAYMLRMGTVKNPIGFLLQAVPKCIEGEALRQYRRLEREGREARARADAEIERQYRAIMERGKIKE
jgi:hypothetical protein